MATASHRQVLQVQQEKNSLRFGDSFALNAKMRYQIRSALHEETKEGWVWISPVQDARATHVRIRNPDSGRTVICEQRVIDENFRRVYNARELTLDIPSEGNVLVISSYYRNLLEGFDTNIAKDLELTPVRGPVASLRAGYRHPSSAVRAAVTLGILSFALGILALLVSFFPR